MKEYNQRDLRCQGKTSCELKKTNTETAHNSKQRNFVAMIPCAVIEKGIATQLNGSSFQVYIVFCQKAVFKKIDDLWVMTNEVRLVPDDFKQYGISRASFYRAIKRLIDLKIIYPSEHKQKGRNGDYFTHSPHLL